MSRTQNFLDHKRTTKAPERSSFASTCNLLTQYLKTKGNLKDLSRSINIQFEALGKSRISQTIETSSTKNLLSSLGDLNEPPAEETRLMDDLPQYTTVLSLQNTEDCINKASTSKEAASECKSAQMTIIYDGQVWVFDSMPAEKAQELLVLVSKENENNLMTTGNSSTTSGAEKNILVGAVSSTSSPPVDLVVPTPAKEKAQIVVPTSAKEKAQVPSDTTDSDLPIARRSSLHRFLEKRKERSIARAPYQVVHDAPGPSSKNDDQLELKL